MRVLVTGGCGFIGSNLVARLLKDERVTFVCVLDNLCNGHEKNIEAFKNHPKFKFIWGDIRDYKTCFEAFSDMDLISHQAALGSVPRSIKDPVTTNATNISGTLNVFAAAREAGIKRVVYAASSSTYGDSKELPKVEENIGTPLSPYGITKLVNEQYAKVFGDLYDMEFIGLRYFNIFGPRQDPNGPYAAVIPLFFQAAIDGKAPTVNGDGTYSRDFTYVKNAVQANMLSLFTDNKEAVNKVYNIACGTQTSLNQLWQYISEIAGVNIPPQYGPNRPGDIPHSLADVSKARELLGYEPTVLVEEGLRKTFGWFREGVREVEGV